MSTGIVVESGARPLSDRNHPLASPARIMHRLPWKVENSAAIAHRQGSGVLGHVALNPQRAALGWHCLLISGDTESFNLLERAGMISFGPVKRISGVKNGAAWLEVLFSSSPAIKGEMVRRKLSDVERNVGLDNLEEAVRDRGFHMIINADQCIIFCNNGDFKVVC